MSLDVALEVGIIWSHCVADVAVPPFLGTVMNSTLEGHAKLNELGLKQPGASLLPQRCKSAALDESSAGKKPYNAWRTASTAASWCTDFKGDANDST